MKRSGYSSNGSKRRSLAAAAVAGVAMFSGAACQSQAFDLFWDGGGGADTKWSNGSNWDSISGEFVPGAIDTAYLNNGGTVTINDAGNTTKSLLIGTVADTGKDPNNLGLGGTINFEDGGELISGAIIPSIDVGVDPGSTNIWNHNGGTVTTAELFRVGVNKGSVATLNMHAGTIDVSTGDTDGLDFFLVGDQGNGTLNMDGGTIKSRGLWAVGLQPNSTSTATITGGTIQGGDFFIAGNSDIPNKFGANATFNMSGGTGSFTGNMHLADSAFATATFNQSGSASITAQREVLVGTWGDATYTISGDATFDAYGQLNVATFTPIERPEGAANAPISRFTQSGNTTVTAAGLVIGEYGHGIYNMNGGTLHVLGQTRGTATVPGTPWTYMLIGRDGGGANQGLGEVTQTAGTVQVDSKLVLGDFDDSTGKYTISGGSLTVAGNVQIGAALATNAPDDATRLEPSAQNGAQGQALRTNGVFTVQGGAATIDFGGQLLANPADKGAFRSGANADNHATLAFQIGDTGGLSRINVAHEADIDGATIDMGFLTSSHFVPAYGQTFDLINAQLFGSTGTGTTQNVGTGSGFVQPAGQAADWQITLVTGTDGRQTLVAKNLVVPGDTDANKKVEFADLLTLAKHYNLATGQTRSTGDFNRTGSVDFDDLLVLAKNYNFTAPAGSLDSASSSFRQDWALAQSLVPEPTSLGLLGGLSMLALRRRQPSRR